ncbi:MAG: hypothetical protein ACKVZ0_22025 [Gemmatimonadales bacterium]
MPWTPALVTLVVFAASSGCATPLDPTALTDGGQLPVTITAGAERISPSVVRVTAQLTNADGRRAYSAPFTISATR